MNNSDTFFLPVFLLFVAFSIYLCSSIWIYRKQITSVIRNQTNNTFVVLFGCIFYVIFIVLIYRYYGGVQKQGGAGSFGDFLNPFITIASLILIYIGIKSDLNSKNEMAKQDKSRRELDKFQELYNKIDEEIYHFNYTAADTGDENGNPIQYNGIRGLIKFSEHFKDNFPFIPDVEASVSVVKFIVSHIHEISMMVVSGDENIIGTDEFYVQRGKFYSFYKTRYENVVLNLSRSKSSLILDDPSFNAMILDIIQNVDFIGEEGN